MSEQEITQDPKTGQFLPGHKWKAPPWRPGHSGHTARYTPGRLVTVCSEYIEQQHTANEVMTWSGLAWHMGLSRRALNKYRDGEIGLDKPGIVHTLEIMATAIEMQREAMLTDKQFATQGVIFALKNHHGWRDEKHLTVEGEVKHELSMVVEGMPKLAQRFENAGVTVDQPVDTPALPGSE